MRSMRMFASSWTSKNESYFVENTNQSSRLHKGGEQSINERTLTGCNATPYLLGLYAATGVRDTICTAFTIGHGVAGRIILVWR